MKLLVLGSTGRCGSWLVRLAHERGHAVTAVARAASAERIPSGAEGALAEVAIGDVTDPAFLRTVLPGHEVVLSGLGLRRRGLHPYARLLSPPDFVERATLALLEAGGADPAVRTIWISAGGVGSSRASTTALVRSLVARGNIGVAYRDLEAAEGRFAAAGADALAVRPVTLVPGAPRGRAGPVRRYRFFSTIRRADVARWMIDVADGTIGSRDPTVLLGTTRPSPGSSRGTESS